MNKKEMHEAMRLILGSDIDLKTDGLWSLRQDVAKDIEKTFGPIECGWDEFIGLSAGTNLINAENGRFVRTGEDLPGEKEFKKSMFRAYSEKMCPPAAAVNLFLMMGVAPKLGLATARHKSGELRNVPTEIVYISDATNKAISSLIEIIINQGEGVVTDVRDSIMGAIGQIESDMPEEIGYVVYYPSFMRSRDIDRHIESIMRLWMIPAGIVSLNNGVFTVLED